MNDIQYELAVDTASKKATAASSKHRVSRGGHYTRMPSDALTEAQKKKLSGPCTSYDLSSPMPWGAFKEMPHDIQQEYLNKLTSMGGTASSVFEMFGRPFSHVTTMGAWFKKNGLKWDSHRRIVPLDEFVRWASKKPVKEVTETIVESRPIDIPKVEEVPVNTAEPPFNAIEGSVTLYANPKDLRDILTMLCGENRRVFTISWGGETDA